MKNAARSPVENPGAAWSVRSGYFDPAANPPDLKETQTIKSVAAGSQDPHLAARFNAYGVVAYAAQLANPEIFANDPDLAKKIHRDIAAAAKAVVEYSPSKLNDVIKLAIDNGLVTSPVADAAHAITEAGGFDESVDMLTAGVISKLYLDELGKLGEN